MRSDRERGSVSLWLVIFTMTVLVLLGFVVDGGQYMNGREQAADIALQAARAAVDDLNIADLRAGRLTLNQDACQQQGPAYTLVSAYAPAGATIPAGGCVPCAAPGAGGGPCVRVTVAVKVSPAIPVGPFGAFTAEAVEQATLDCGSATAPTAC